MDAPDDLALWSLHCYCPTARQTPHAMARRHGRLLLSQDVTADAGALAELVAAGLVDPATGAPSFPILGPDRIGPVRQRMAALAARVVAGCAGQIRALKAGPGLLLGHVFDTLLWSRLEGLALPETGLTEAHPDWRGAFWAVWPKVPGAIGTNHLEARGWYLTMVWCEENTARLKALSREPWLPAALAGLDGGAVPEEAVAAGLFDPQGAPWFAILEPASALDRALDRLADRAGEVILANHDRLALPGLRPETAHVVALHELIWALPEALRAEGLWDASGYPDDLAAALVARRA